MEVLLERYADLSSTKASTNSPAATADSTAAQDQNLQSLHRVVEVVPQGHVLEQVTRDESASENTSRDKDLDSGSITSVVPKQAKRSTLAFSKDHLDCKCGEVRDEVEADDTCNGQSNAE